MQRQRPRFLTVLMGLRLCNHRIEGISQSAAGSHSEPDCAVCPRPRLEVRGRGWGLGADISTFTAACIHHTRTPPAPLHMRDSKSICVAFSFLSSTCVGAFLLLGLCLLGSAG